MKRTLPILSIAVLITTILLSLMACQSKKAPDSLVLSATDTSGLAEFQSWKSMNEAKTASNFYIQGYKDAIAAKPATKTTVVHKSVPAVAPTTAAHPVKRKGWSKAAKSTAVGTAAGAIAGAIINKKNRVAGGVIGGILGGGIGYGVGRSMDKKDGRF